MADLECRNCGLPKRLHPVDDCPRWSPYDPDRPFRTSCASCNEILHNVDGRSQKPICPHCGGVTYA